MEVPESFFSARTTYCMQKNVEDFGRIDSAKSVHV